MGIPSVAWTFPLAREAVVSFRTQPGGASLAGVAGLAQTHSVGVVAFAVILTATCLGAASAVRANWTLVLATAENGRHRGAFCFVVVTLASDMKQRVEGHTTYFGRTYSILLSVSLSFRLSVLPNGTLTVLLCSRHCRGNLQSATHKSHCCDTDTPPNSFVHVCLLDRAGHILYPLHTDDKRSIHSAFIM